jgi:hypothetical protein
MAFVKGLETPCKEPDVWLTKANAADQGIQLSTPIDLVQMGKSVHLVMQVVKILELIKNCGFRFKLLLKRFSLVMIE